MSAETLPDAPDSPVATAYAAGERAASYFRAFEAALDELKHALAEASLDDLERQLSNFRERQRPVAHWLSLVVKRIAEVAP